MKKNPYIPYTPPFFLKKTADFRRFYKSKKTKPLHKPLHFRHHPIIDPHPLATELRDFGLNRHQIEVRV
jgi:hypothetical protein